MDKEDHLMQFIENHQIIYSEDPLLNIINKFPSTTKQEITKLVKQNFHDICTRHELNHVEEEMEPIGPKIIKVSSYLYSVWNNNYDEEDNSPEALLYDIMYELAINYAFQFVS